MARPNSASAPAESHPDVAPRARVAECPIAWLRHARPVTISTQSQPCSVLVVSVTTSFSEFIQEWRRRCWLEGSKSVNQVAKAHPKTASMRSGSVGSVSAPASSALGWASARPSTRSRSLSRDATSAPGAFHCPHGSQVLNSLLPPIQLMGCQGRPSPRASGPSQTCRVSFHHWRVSCPGEGERSDFRRSPRI